MSKMEITLFQLGLVLTGAAIFGMTAKLFKQPAILGYMFAGMVISYFLLDEFTGNILDLFSQLGIAFLLFLIGVELNVREIKEVGWAALTTGIGQVVVTSTIGFAILRIGFGFDLLPALYMAAALTFSSTIIVVKLLGDKGDTNSLYGRIAVGLLIVQDLIAVLVLVLLHGVAGVQGANIPAEIVRLGLTGVLLVAIAYIFGRGLELLLEHVGKTTDLLLLSVLSWALLFAFVAKIFGFSLEMGAFIAGLVLSTSQMSAEISVKVKPLRDFFIVLFFVVLGMHLRIESFGPNLLIIGVLSAFVLIGNPIILLTIMGMLGYHRRVSFLTGLTVAQVSEFSLILITTGIALGQVDDNLLSVITGVAIVTFAGSSYLIQYGDHFYRKLAKHLKIFQRTNKSSVVFSNRLREKAILIIGTHRMGGRILAACVENDIPVVAVDFDPLALARLKKLGIPYVYGDLGDPELIDQFDLKTIKAIVSTVPDYNDNLILLGKLKSQSGNKPFTVVRSESIREESVLRQLGADYVLIPEEVAGEKVVGVLKDHGIFETTPVKQ